MRKYLLLLTLGTQCGGAFAFEGQKPAQSIETPASSPAPAPTRAPKQSSASDDSPAATDTKSSAAPETKKIARKKSVRPEPGATLIVPVAAAQATGREDSEYAKALIDAFRRASPPIK